MAHNEDVRSTYEAVPSWLAAEFYDTIAACSGRIRDEEAAARREREEPPTYFGSSRTPLSKKEQDLIMGQWRTAELARPEDVRDWERDRRDPKHYPVRAIAAALAEISSQDGTTPEQQGFGHATAYARALLSTLSQVNTVAGINLRATNLSKPMVEDNLQIADWNGTTAEDAKPRYIGSGLLIKTDNGHPYLLLNFGKDRNYSDGSISQRWGWYALRTGQLEVLRRQGGTARIVIGVGNRAQTLEEYRRTVNNPAWQALDFLDLQTTSVVTEPGAAIQQGAEQSNTEEPLAPAFLKAAYGKLKELPPDSQDDVANIFGRSSSMSMRAVPKYVDLGQQSAASILRPEPFFRLTTHGSTNPRLGPDQRLVPYAFAAENLPEDHPVRQRWLASEGVLSGHADSVAAIAGMHEDHCPKWLMVYADAILQLYGEATIWQTWLDAQNVSFAVQLGDIRTDFSSATVYLAHDQRRAAPDQVIPSQYRGDNGSSFNDTPGLAGHLSQLAQQLRGKLHTGRLADKDWDTLMTITEMGANGIDMLALDRWILAQQ